MQASAGNSLKLFNTPTLLKGKSQLEPEDIVRDRRVASERIHVERVIGLAEQFNFLNKSYHSPKFL